MSYIKAAPDTNAFRSWKYVYVTTGLRDDIHNLYFE